MCWTKSPRGFWRLSVQGNRNEGTKVVISIEVGLFEGERIEGGKVAYKLDFVIRLRKYS
jgi:hypothetical protein